MMTRIRIILIEKVIKIIDLIFFNIHKISGLSLSMEVDDNNIPF